MEGALKGPAPHDHLGHQHLRTQRLQLRCQGISLARDCVQLSPRLSDRILVVAQPGYFLALHECERPEALTHTSQLAKGVGARLLRELQLPSQLVSLSAMRG